MKIIIIAAFEETFAILKFLPQLQVKGGYFINAWCPNEHFSFCKNSLVL